MISMIGHKGSIYDILTVFIAIFATGMFMAMVVVLGRNFVHPVLSNLTAMGANQTEMEEFQTNYNKEETAMDYFTPALFVGIFLLALISAFMINTLPFFAFVYVIASVPILIFSFIGQNVWVQWAQGIGVTAETMPITYTFLANIHWVLLITDIILGVVMFSKIGIKGL